MWVSLISILFQYHFFMYAVLIFYGLYFSLDSCWSVVRIAFRQCCNKGHSGLTYNMNAHGLSLRSLLWNWTRVSDITASFFKYKFEQSMYNHSSLIMTHSLFCRVPDVFVNYWTTKKNALNPSISTLNYCPGIPTYVLFTLYRN